MKRSTRFPLTLALLLSLLAHLALLASGLLPSWGPVPEDKLAPISIELTAMRLDNAPSRTAQPAAAPPDALHIAALPAPPRPTPKPALKSDASSLDARADASAPAAEASASDASAPIAAEAADSENDSARLAPEHALKRFPKTAELKYQVYYGALMAGIAVIDWQRDGARYTLESRITPIIGPRLRYRSSGTLNHHGLQPDDYAAWRNDTPREHAHFDWDNQVLDFGDDNRQQTALQHGAQDIFSLIYQLALKGAEAPPVQITTGKKVYEYPLAPVGQADFDTGFGKIRALVFRAAGSDDTTEFWLAPDFANQPIRIIRSDSRMKLDMRVTDIVIDDNSAWHLPKPTQRKHEK
ncbi:MAG: DUF3108 domain-containing protein [Paludibacterium sp.]|uniref:DUF3108 domain-containing protein n=1 Tax=Paludibacterium sp. TaxID=1917523 RepID=UPI0025EB38E6|nr:DUF3108 domain-containing protein [Paludibacterium sp.]MBV8047340.1 DUF3108 domain-containing protein [Paludibacterium sp.]MBV8646650.1 DUF3108 domain-containing protein [Paludibacterium sp.]